jgi:hypothetical protein
LTTKLNIIPLCMRSAMHRMVGIHLVDQPDLHPLADRELPVDRAAVGTHRPVHQRPMHRGVGRHPVDLDHVVFPLDPVPTPMTAMVAMRIVVVMGSVVVRSGV